MSVIVRVGEHAADRAGWREARLPGDAALERDADDAIIELPAPTAWPMVAALGHHARLRRAGDQWLVTRRRRRAHHRRRGRLVPRRAAGRGRRAHAAARRRRGAPGRCSRRRARSRTSSPGEAGHRVRIPVEIHPYSAGVLGRARRRRGDGGAGACSTASSPTAASGIRSTCSPRWRCRRSAHADTGAARGASTATALGVAAVAHLVISIFVGLVYAAILPMFPRRPALWGGLVAPLVWTGLLWASLGVINPTLNARIDWPLVRRLADRLRPRRRLGHRPHASASRRCRAGRSPRAPASRRRG